MTDQDIIYITTIKQRQICWIEGLNDGHRKRTYFCIYYAPGTVLNVSYLLSYLILKINL